jgi:hypothetical protein
MTKSSRPEFYRRKVRKREELRAVLVLIGSEEMQRYWSIILLSIKMLQSGPLA